jgi:hypothetical protein
MMNLKRQEYRRPKARVNERGSVLALAAVSMMAMLLAGGLARYSNREI